MQRVIYLSPEATNSLPDIRGIFQEALSDAPTLGIGFQGPGHTPFAITRWVDGEMVDAEYSPQVAHFDMDPTSTHDLDYFVTSTSLRILIDGNEIVDATFEPIGFDIAYIYFGQATFNSRRADFDGVMQPDTLQWDNISFDGPLLPFNGLTPVGYEDVLFRAFSSTACTIGGIPAHGPDAGFWSLYSTWRVRVPVDSGLTLDEISCLPYPERYGDPGDGVPLRDLEVIRQL